MYDEYISTWVKQQASSSSSSSFFSSFSLSLNKSDYQAHRCVLVCARAPQQHSIGRTAVRKITKDQFLFPRKKSTNTTGAHSYSSERVNHVSSLQKTVKYFFMIIQIIFKIFLDHINNETLLAQSAMASTVTIFLLQKCKPLDTSSTSGLLFILVLHLILKNFLYRQN